MPGQISITTEPARWHDGQPYDIIVVGGGPSACAFLQTLRRQPEATQLRVLVLEKYRFPRDKVCGDGLTFLTLPLLREIFPKVDFPLRRRGKTPITAHVPFGRRKYQVCSEIDVLPRYELDALLWKSLKDLGFELVEEAVVSDLLWDKMVVVGVIAQIGGVRQEFRGKVVIGADGSSGIVRRKTGTVIDDAQIMAVRQYVKGVPQPKDGLAFYFQPDGNGYFWFFPFERGGQWWANIGYGRNDKLPLKLKRHYEAFLQDPRITSLLGDGVLQGRIEAFPLNLMRMRGPWMAPARTMWGPGFLLLGDAAGLIHPYSGEGISFALESGKLAAKLLAKGDGVEAAGRLYQKRLLVLMKPSHVTVLGYLALRVPNFLPSWMLTSYYAALTFVVRAVKKGLGPLFVTKMAQSKFAGELFPSAN